MKLLDFLQKVYFSEDFQKTNPKFGRSKKKWFAATRFSLKIPSAGEKSLINQDFEKSLKVYTNRQKWSK